MSAIPSADDHAAPYMVGLPDALCDPGAYRQRPKSVELRETHSSWVFLADRMAYKVKKPVRLPFVDYGTLERRRACCEAELALNRRFSTGRYREVVALVPRGPHGLAVTSERDSRAVEYAVVMNRYDESMTLAAHLADGDATDADLVAVGAAIAGFHAASPVEAGAGTSGLDTVLDETIATLRTAGAPARRLQALANFCAAALVGLGPELTHRAQAGRVRDGHGDLRAEHILLGTEIQAVDGVEFDRALRVADVGYDLAFLIMDVARCDDDLARSLLRGYRLAGGDPGSEGLLDFLCAVRALVRAKVDFLRAEQLGGAAADERVARAHELFGVAERFAWRARLPEVTCVTGLAASGKSTLAEALAAAAGRTVLSSDRIRKLRAGLAPLAKAGPSAYGDAASRAVYSELGERAATAVGSDGGVIVDATFRRGNDADAFAAASHAASRAAWIVCEAPPEVLLERAAARARHDSVSDAGPAVVAQELATYRGPFLAPAASLARLDTTYATPALLAELADVLDARLRAAAPKTTASSPVIDRCEEPSMPAPIIAAFDPFFEDHAPIELALAAAELTGASVIVAAVAASPYFGSWADPYATDTSSDETIESSLARLRDACAVQTRCVTDASVSRALHALARDEDASMIVVGSTGRGDAGRALPGSTAERLLHGSPCPVALAPIGYVRTPVETIAVGFVNSPEGHAALAVAHRLAERADAKLRVIVALHPSSALDAPTSESAPPPRGQALEGRHRASVNATVTAALNALPAGVEVEPEFHVDDPADVLLRVSEHVDLLVCGSRGYGPLRSVLLGGVSRRLVDGAHSPVLVLPRGAGRPLRDLISETSAAASVAG